VTYRDTETVFRDHLSKRDAGLLEEDLHSNYSPDVLLFSTFGIFRGVGGVRESAQRLFTALGPSRFSYDVTLVEGDYAYLEWSAESDSARITDGADGFVIEHGAIVMQTVHYTVELRTA
jgi:hypothetical protein